MDTVYAVHIELANTHLEDGDVSEEVPRVGLEEMLQEMNISDEGGGGARGARGEQ